MNLSAHQFEEFLYQLFRDSGYNAELTKKSGDFGADIILSKGSTKIAVQVKRYDQDRAVGVKEINQAIGAKAFYGCDEAWVITTSAFTKPGIGLARRTQTELWDWERLHEYIKQVYLKGKDIYALFEKEPDIDKINDFKNLERPDDVSSKFKFEVICIDENVLMEDASTPTVVHVKMKNCSAEKIYITFILKAKLQVKFMKDSSMYLNLWVSILKQAQVPLSQGAL